MTPEDPALEEPCRLPRPADGPPPVPLDLRTVVLGAAAWLGALGGRAPHGWVVAVVVAGSAASAMTMLVMVLGTVRLAAAGRRSASPRQGRRRLVAAALAVGAGVCAMAAMRAEAVRGSALSALAQEGAAVRAELVLRSDPRTTQGRFGEVTVVRAVTRTVQGRGEVVAAPVPVLVIGDDEWSHQRLGAVVAARGRLSVAEDGDVAAILYASGGPVRLRAPPLVYRAADDVRVAVRRAAAGGPGEGAALVPGLVTGDDQQLPDPLVAEFRTAGLTHLTAVSGTNLTLVLATVLFVGRWAGIRGRARVPLGLLGVAGFVLLARPEPSVLRAAAMGTVALLGLGLGSGPGVRALGAGILALLVVDPALAVSPGFALSALATAGILLVGPGYRRALMRWMPRWSAEAIAVPTAAQLACTPLIAALSGQVSLVAVAANLVVAPLVAPATVLGLLGGLVTLVAPAVGSVLGWLAGACAQLIVTIAHLSASVPGAAVSWPAGGIGLAVLSVLCASGLLAGGRLLRSRRTVLGVVGVVMVATLQPVRLAALVGLAADWPPRGWILVMCDVGQGDALVLGTGPGEAVVVDTGPDPALVDGCLRRLRVSRVPAVVLTHFHADHIDGLSGVLDHRAVGEIEVSPLREPAPGAAQVDAVAAAAHLPVRVPTYGETRQVGNVTWQEVGPRRLLSDSPNDSSLVLLVQSHGIRLLLTGDVEPPSQAAMLRVGLPPVDVLKVPHHGSRYQDPQLLTGSGARVALVSVGADNDYGHPAASTLRTLQGTGALVRRTDQDGDVAVAVREGRLTVFDRG